jgi:peptide/nickel transport system substrate-binding protein
MGVNLIGFDALYNNLVRLELVDPKTWEHKVVGDLAESWEQPDSSTLIFALKSGITFQDGTPFTAEVAAWNILRARDHPKSFLKTPLADIASAEAIDRNALRVKLKNPNAGFLRNFASPYSTVGMMSKAALDKLGEQGFARNPVGTGPFRLKQWITDDRLILERNPNYFEKGADGKPLPYLDSLVSRYVPDPAVALVDMRAGTLHLLERVPAKDVATIRGDSNLVTYEQPWAGEVFFFGGFNVKRPPFNNLKVRQAALYGIDREGMARTLGFGLGVPYYYGEWARGSMGYDESIVRHEYNPAKVKELLREAGYPDGISIELKVIAREPESTIGEYAQQMWTAVGIKTKLVSMERLAWIDHVRAMNFDTCFWRGGFGYTAVDPDAIINRIGCGAPANWGQWCDPDVDRLM